MRVLMLGWEFPPRVAGGLGVACEGLVRGLREVGVDVTLVLPSGGAPGAQRRAESRRRGKGSLQIVDASEADARPAADAAADRVRWSRIDPYAAAAPSRGTAPGGASRVEAPHASSGRRGPARASDSLYGPDLADAVQRYASAVARIAARRRFDVVHAHDWMTFLAGVAAKQVSGRPLVAHVHATELDRSGREGAGSPASLIERRTLPIADRVVAVSAYTAGILREQYGVCEDRLRVLHNAIDAPNSPRRRRRSGPPLVLFVGRVTRQKGPEQFVRAAALVAYERPDVRFALAGDGDRLEAVRAEAEALGLASRIRFTGFLPRPALDRLYSRADVFVMPSVSEPFGLVALEAASHGTPAIVSRASGVSEVLRHALRVDFGDLEELAAKIVAVLELPHLRETLVESGAEEVRRLSWRAAGERCAAIYAELGEPPSPTGARIAVP